ncbi:MAG TPA: LacI family transcriptional regulator, partial [Propionibacteriaceae bacterium]|nr:LacI family transcriptional regulator [Propionibacteriaceae bacterium]
VICCSTPLAAVGLGALEQVGRAVPGDVAFATFDGFRYPELFRPRLTTVRQPAFEMGVSAVQLLVSRLADPDSSPRTVRLHQTLELRESTEGFAPRPA